MEEKKDFLDKDWFIREIAREGNFLLGDAKTFVGALQAVLEKAIDLEIPLDVRGLLHLEVKEVHYKKGARPKMSKLKLNADGIHPPSKKIVFRLSKNLKDRVRK